VRRDASGQQRLVIGQPSATFIELTPQGEVAAADALKDPRQAHAEESMFLSDVCGGLRARAQGMPWNGKDVLPSSLIGVFVDTDVGSVWVAKCEYLRVFRPSHRV
jgi:hypothetical protein